MTYTIAYLAYALGQATLAVLTFRIWRAERSATALTLMLPMATVVYDNVMIALGSFIGEGALLEVLTVPRFVGHALFTPIWIVGAVSLAVRFGAFARWRKVASVGSWVLYGIMVGIGLLNEVVYFVGEFVSDGDVVYYTNIGRLFTPPPPSLAMLITVLACGLVVWRRASWPWMTVGALAVLLAQIFQGGEAAFVFINSGEVLMSLALYASLVKVRNVEAAEAEAERLSSLIDQALGEGRSGSPDSTNQ